MIWQIPKTDWSDGELLTYEDMNRITGNIKYLYPNFTLKTQWSQNDIISTADWLKVQSALSLLIQTSGVIAPVPDGTMNAGTMCDIETLIDQLHTRIELNLAQKIANIYPAEQAAVYANETAENYVRGF